jgi:formylglycine-generating enzyme required for sulfatase activity
MVRTTVPSRRTRTPPSTPTRTAGHLAGISYAGAGIWTDTPGPNESNPMSCMTWYELFAFCAWDGRRLPTEAEWNYVAAGGDEQREYPWGSAPIDSAHAVYGSATASARVGSRSTAGDGRWGNADLAGNVMEWNFDSYVYPYPDSGASCVDCAVLVATPYRVVRGGGFGGVAEVQQTFMRYDFGPGGRVTNLGGRCVADPIR